MVKQTAISARLDNILLWMLEQEKMVSGQPRNRMINEGTRAYLELRRAKRAYNKASTAVERRKILRGFLKLYFPETNNSF